MAGGQSQQLKKGRIRGMLLKKSTSIVLSGQNHRRSRL